MTDPSQQSIAMKDRDSAIINSEIASRGTHGASLVLVGADGHDCIGVYLQESIKIEVKGSLGDYCFLANQNAAIEIHGDVDAACGQSIAGGSILIRGNSGVSTGSFAQGGWVAVYGTAGPRCAVGLIKGEVIVRGNAGPRAGWKMRGGTLVIGGSAGAELGLDMEGGLIFVRGEVESVAQGVEEFRLKEADHFKLGLLMLKAGIKAAGKDFRGYRKGIPES